MTDNINFNDYGNGSFDNGALHNSRGEAKELQQCLADIKELSASMKENAKIVTDTIESFCNVMLTPDGRPVDISDKVGRAKLQASVAANAKMLETVHQTLDGATSKIQSAIPAHVDARFSDDDRMAISSLYKDKRKYYIYLWCGVFLAGVFSLLAIIGSVMNSKKTAKLNDWYEEQKEAIDFGNYLKENNPRTLRSWRSGEWKKNEETQQAIHEKHRLDSER